VKEESINNNRKHMRQDRSDWLVSRRCFLKYSGAVLTAYSFGATRSPNTTDEKHQARFGIVTDIHYANTPTAGTRHYWESLKKLNDCVELMNQEKVDFLIELGDFKDQNSAGDEKSSLQYLTAIESVFQQYNGNRYHVLGNHDVDSISKCQFLELVENSDIAKKLRFYSFDLHDLHFIVLDANNRSDGSDYDHGNFDWTDANIPRPQLKWLKQDIASTSNPVIVFIHQQLDGHDEYCVRNSSQVRKILQESKKVLIVFQGHKHSGDYSCIENIHYYTLRAMVEGHGKENNSYAIVDVYADYNIVVSGYQKAASKKMGME